MKISEHVDYVDVDDLLYTKIILHQCR